MLENKVQTENNLNYPSGRNQQVSPFEGSTDMMRPLSSEQCHTKTITEHVLESVTVGRGGKLF